MTSEDICRVKVVLKGLYIRHSHYRLCISRSLEAPAAITQMTTPNNFTITQISTRNNFTITQMTSPNNFTITQMTSPNNFTITQMTN